MSRRYLSICSGIEAATVAWHPLGWQPVAFSEIEPFPCAVLKHHYPEVRNLGDMTRHEEWDIAPGSVDLLVGGTPCQSFSVAGKRGGLEDERGNLCLCFCKIADRLDPEWILWENVPGVLSDHTNAFGCLLGELSGSSDALVSPGGRWANAGLVAGPKRTVAWRVLDAQYFGVAQRRRRVFVLAVRGAGNWAGAAALFPVGEGVHWDSAPRREAGQRVAPSVACGPPFSRTRNERVAADAVVPVAPPITSKPYGDHVSREGLLVPEAAGTLGGASQSGGFRTTDLDNQGAFVPAVVPQAMSSKWAKGTSGPAGDEVANLVPAFVPQAKGGDVIAVAFAQNTRDEVRETCGNIAGALAAEPGMKQQTYVAFQPRIARNGRGDMGDVVNAIQAQSWQTGKGDAAPCVAFSCKDHGADAGDVSPALRAMGHEESHANGGGQVAVAAQYAVRRLTPRECERLQGFPDDYTLIPWRSYQEWARRKDTSPDGDSFEDWLIQTTGRGLREPTTQDCPDGPRYKALGNSMAVPCMRWIGQRIELAERLMRGD